MLAAVAPAPILRGASFERTSLEQSFFYFEENAGQADAEVRYLIRGVRIHNYLTANALVLDSGYQQSTVKIRFSAEGSKVTAHPIEPWGGKLNRYEGAPLKSYRAIPAHRRVEYRGMHPNVKAIFGRVKNGLSLTFVVHAGGDPGQLFLESGTPTSIEGDGTWRVRATTHFYIWSVPKPRAWQASFGAWSPVEARYRHTEGEVRFELGEYDRTRPLFVEVTIPLDSLPPAISRWDADAAGNVYLAGSVSSSIPCRTTPGATHYCTDAFVAAVDSGGEPIFLTVLAGRREESALQIAWDGTSESVVMVGWSGSTDFPVTEGAYQSENRGPFIGFPRYSSSMDGDCFVARVDGRSGALSRSTYFGGPEHDLPVAMALGGDGSVTLLLRTGKSLPTTAGAWMNSACEACEPRAVARLDATLSRLLLSTFVPSRTNGIAVHTDMSTYLAGSATEGAQTTPGALQSENAGGDDAYLVRLAPDGSGPIYATS